MAKKYVLRSFKPGDKKHNKVNTLINLSALGLNSSQSILKNSLSVGASESVTNTAAATLFPYDEDVQANPFHKYKDITKNSAESYAYFDLSYPQRVEYLRMLSQHQTISFVLDTVADESIVIDENNYFAHLDVDKLKLNLSANNEQSQALIDTCTKAFERVYTMFGWDKSNGAWNTFKKFLIEGYIAFEIIYDNKPEYAREIIGFKELDPATLEPGIEYGADGKEQKVWYQNRGDSNQRTIPDAHMIYISWADGSMGGQTRISYLEGLSRSFQMLTQIENSRLMWNIMNSGKRTKMIIPVGDLSPYKADTLMNQIKAEWNEDVYIDDFSGQVVVNGVPNFSFNKMYFFPQRTSGTIDISEISVEGYDLSSIDPMKYFWRRFILETKIPANRFTLDVTADSAHTLNGDDASITREEYAFGRFVNRIRSIFREVLLKPVWIQVCLYMPKLAKSEYLKQAIGIVFNDENMFAEAKERTAIQQGVNVINTLYALQGADGKPIFSMKFLVERYLNISEDDMELNKRYKEEETLELLNRAKSIKQHQEYNAQQGNQAPQVAQEGGNDFGGGFGGGDDFGAGGNDFGGGDFGGGDDFGGGGTAEDFGGGDAGGGDF